MICSFMDSSGLASEPIKRCLFIGYIIIALINTMPTFENRINPDQLAFGEVSRSEFTLLLIDTKYRSI